MKFLNPALGTMQFTDEQLILRERAKGRYWATTADAAPTQTFLMKYWPDNTVDMIRLEAGLDGCYDLGGQGAVDFRAGRI